MSTADWIILGFVVFSAAGAAIAGFFHEAFKLVGLVVGYLLAAWQYYRLAASFLSGLGLYSAGALLERQSAAAKVRALEVAFAHACKTSFVSCCSVNVRNRGDSERSTGSAHSPDVQEQHSLFGSGARVQETL